MVEQFSNLVPEPKNGFSVAKNYLNNFKGLPEFLKENFSSIYESYSCHNPASGLALSVQNYLTYLEKFRPWKIYFKDYCINGNEEDKTDERRFFCALAWLLHSPGTISLAGFVSLAKTLPDDVCEVEGDLDQIKELIFKSRIILKGDADRVFITSGYVVKTILGRPSEGNAKVKISFKKYATHTVMFIDKLIINNNNPDSFIKVHCKPAIDTQHHLRWNQIAFEVIGGKKAEIYIPETPLVKAKMNEFGKLSDENINMVNIMEREDFFLKQIKKNNAIALKNRKYVYRFQDIDYTRFFMWRVITAKMEEPVGLG